MKILIIALGLLAFSSPAFAYLNCTTFGNQTTCYGSDNQGNMGSATCTTFGNQITCW